MEESCHCESVVRSSNPGANLVVALRGCRYQTSGKERENEQFCGGMLFADHTSRHATINYQTSLAGGETSLSHCERVKSSCGVTINHNHADNGIFAAASFYKNYVPINHIFTAASFPKDRITINHNHAEDGIFTAVSFCEDCTLKNQELSFSAANSHHQNEVAER